MLSIGAEQRLLLICAPISELPSNINNMTKKNIKHVQSLNEEISGYFKAKKNSLILKNMNKKYRNFNIVKRIYMIYINAVFVFLNSVFNA